jgi:hypothetical protein
LVARATGPHGPASDEEATASVSPGGSAWLSRIGSTAATG